MWARALGRDRQVALCSWRAFAEAGRQGEQLRQLLGERVAALELRNLSGVYLRWARLARLEGVALRAAAALRHRGARRGLRGWRHSCCAARVLASMGRRRKDKLRGGLAAWCARARVLRRVGELTGANSRRDGARLLAACCSGWRRLTEHRAALRLREEYLLSRTTWYARQAILSHWAAAATSRPQLRRALARYCTSLCARVLGAWRGYAFNTVAARGELLRAHANQLALEQHRRRARARQLHLVYAAWRDHAGGRGKRRRLSRTARVVLPLARSLAVWRVFAAGAAQARLLTEAGDTHRFRAVRRRAAHRLPTDHRPANGVSQSWDALAPHMSVGARVPRLAAAWEPWAAQARRAAVLRVLTQRRACRTAIAFLHAWRAVLAQHTSARSAGRAADTRWAEATVGRCWYGWRGAFAARQAERIALEAASADLVLRRDGRARAEAFAAWRAQALAAAARGAARRSVEARLASAAAYHLQRLGGLVFFHWRALSWSRNWERPGRMSSAGTEQRRQRALAAALLVHGSVAHQAAASQAFQHGHHGDQHGAQHGDQHGDQHGGHHGAQHGQHGSLAGSLPSSTAPTAPGSPLGLLTSGTTQRRSPIRAHVRDFASSPTKLALAVALGAQLVDNGEGGEGVRGEAAASRRHRPPSSRRLFRSTSSGGFASFGQWLHTKEGDAESVSTDG